MKKIPLEDFFRNPEVSNYQISPDGKYFSYLKPYQNRLNIFLRPRKEDGIEERLTHETERDLPLHFWKGNDHILYMKDFGGDENFHLFCVSPNGGQVQDLTPFEGVKITIIDILYGKDDELLLAMNQRERELFDVYHLNVRTAELNEVARNPGGMTSWLADHEGRVRVGTSNDGVHTSIYFRENEDQEFQCVLTTDFREQVDPIFFTFDNQNLYVSSNRGRDKRAIFVFDPKTAKEGDVVFEHPEVDCTELTYSKRRKVLADAPFVTWKTERKFFDQARARAYGRVAEVAFREELHLVALDKEERCYVFRSVSDRSLGAYYFYDDESGQVQKLREVSPWLSRDDLCPMKPVTYRARDGVEIQAYLTLPQGSEGKRLPIVLNPHGGPWARDNWGFNPEVQFLANRGYGVLQPNFRGSIGFGRAFWEASFKEWGRSMQDDLTDGVNWLIDQGIADPKRVGIYGGSYGGYATLAGMTFTPDLYTCGVDYVGVSNLFTFLKTIPPYWKVYLEMLHEMVGHPEKDKVLLEETSPLFHVDKIKAPILVAQGANDPRVNIKESDQIVEALRKKDIPVEYMVKENEGHGFRNQENKFEFYRAMEKFLAKHLA